MGALCIILENLALTASVSMSGGTNILLSEGANVSLSGETAIEEMINDNFGVELTDANFENYLRVDDGDKDYWVQLTFSEQYMIESITIYKQAGKKQIFASASVHSSVFKANL